MTTEATPLLQVKNLKTHFQTPDGIAKVVNDLSFSLAAGRTLAVVGESGSGKTMLARSIMGLIPQPPGIHAGGEIQFDGKNLCALNESQLSRLRGKDLAMIFQDPMTSLNPVLTIGEQVVEVLVRHLNVNKKTARRDAVQLLNAVGIPAPEKRINEYPHQLSGGLRQRVVIAMAVVCKPKLLIADEPTTALDVSVQAQILRLLKKLQRDNNMAMIFVSHDLGTVAGIADDLAVMYAGKIVETGPVKQVIQWPRMHYTRALLQSIPRLDNPSHTRLNVIGGRPPNLSQLPRGCAFADRCQFAAEKCRQSVPPLSTGADTHRYACWFPHENNKVSA